MSVVMGLDISSSCSGVCILEPGRVIHAGCIVLDVYDSFYERSYALARYIEAAVDRSTLNIDAVWIEESYAHMVNGTSAHVVQVLNRINGAAEHIAHEATLAPVYTLMANQARARLGIPQRKGVCGIPAKQLVVDHLLQHDEVFREQVYPTLPTYNNGLHHRAYDTVDAYVMALIGLREEEKKQ